MPVKSRMLLVNNPNSGPAITLYSNPLRDQKGQ